MNEVALEDPMKWLMLVQPEDLHFGCLDSIIMLYYIGTQLFGDIRVADHFIFICWVSQNKQVRQGR